MHHLIIGLSLALSLAACGATSKPPSPNPEPGACIKTGCSGTVCSDHEVITTCEYRPEYACYKTAICERQAGGGCGWTQTPELSACLASPPPM